MSWGDYLGRAEDQAVEIMLSGGSAAHSVPGPEQRIGTNASPSRCEQAATITVRARQAWSEVPHRKTSRADGKYIGDQVSAVVAASGTSNDPKGYGQTVAHELFPDVLPYVVGTPATFGFATRNGRTLADNAPEVMMSLVAGTAVPSGLKPSVAQHLRSDKFPYVVPA
jgi:hypothetical protein